MPDLPHSMPTRPKRRSRLVAAGLPLLGFVLSSVCAHALARQEEAAPSEAAPEDAAHAEPNDVICGPRCVQYLLEYYGQEADLIELAREVQWPDWESGASLDALASALHRRGIHTFAMQIAPHARLTWDYPAVVHLNVPGKALGDYVVWLPSSRSGRAGLWCGFRGLQQVSDQELADQRSGAVLLTSPRDIANPDDGVARFTSATRVAWMVAAAIVGAVAAAGLCLWRSGARRTLSRPVLPNGES